MTSFLVEVPYNCEAIAAFKIASDIFAYDYKHEKNRFIQTIDDENANVTLPLTLGVFRLDLQGLCSIIDRDFDNHVSLISCDVHDKRGNGKIASRIRISIDEKRSQIRCDCDVKLKGMLSRVNLPVSDVFSKHIKNILGSHIESLTSEELVFETIDDSIENAIGLTNISRPWLSVIQFPGKVFGTVYIAIRRFSALFTSVA